MDEESKRSPDPGFVPFRASRALAGSAPGMERVPPPLPPPPPGASPAPPVPVAPSRTASPGRERPPLPAPGTSLQETWATLVGWCASAGIADGGFLTDAAGSVVAARGEPPAGAPGELLEGLAGALAPARRSAGGGPSAAAVDVGGRWMTAFAVAATGRGELVAVLWGTAPLRSGVRAALAGWLREALYSP